jgi:hypothetical protein
VFEFFLGELEKLAAPYADVEFIAHEAPKGQSHSYLYASLANVCMPKLSLYQHQGGLGEGQMNITIGLTTRQSTCQVQ